MAKKVDLIPSPPVVRDRLARSQREIRLLRRLLRLSIAAAEEKRYLANQQVARSQVVAL